MGREGEGRERERESSGCVGNREKGTLITLQKM